AKRVQAPFTGLSLNNASNSKVNPIEPTLCTLVINSDTDKRVSDKGFVTYNSLDEGE
uniref:Kinesin motor domain-containing protein n=1 Tax=Schistosoma curassoni TaxID=6186 RepID=A0A183KLT8_9TREM